MSESEVLIIGGGISGLATAWWLAQQNIAVEVWEADTQPGGKIRSTREQGYLTERAAGLLVNFRPQIDQLINNSGLAEQKRGRGNDLNRYVVHRGRLAQVPMQLPGMALSPLWSWQAKLRLLGELLIPRGGSDDESVSRFIERRLGRELLETAIDPFIAGTLASDPDLANARAVLPRLTALAQRYGSITLGMLINRVLKRRRANQAETFSFQNGMAALIQALTSSPNVHLRCGISAHAIERNGTSWEVSGDSDEGSHCTRARQLVISTPADSASTLLQPHDSELAAHLSRIDYAPLAVLHLGFSRSQIRHPLDGSGFLVPRREGLKFNGNLWMSNLFPDRAPAGHALLTCYLGGARAPARTGLPTQQLIDETLAQLAPLLDLHGDPDYVRIDRHRRALPLYHGDYLATADSIRRRIGQLSGLHLTANYLDGVSVRERLFQGMNTARRIRQQLAQRTEHYSAGCTAAPDFTTVTSGVSR